MKKIFLAFYLFTISIFLSAQNFEGVLKYDLKYEGEMVQQFAAMMPNSYTLKLKGDNSRFAIQGGMVSSFMGDIITNAKGISYMLMPSEKTAYKISDGTEDTKNDKVDYKVTNTGISETIKGYKCNKYKIVIKSENGEDVTTYLWASKDLEVKLPNSSSRQNAIRAYEGVEGFPVKIEQNMNQMGISFTMTIMLNEAKPVAVADSEFKLPADYKVQDGMPNFGGMMGK